MAEHADDADALARLGELQHQLEERDGWRLEQKVELVVSRLALPADRPMRELSGGWRRRALLGKALVSEPDLLLLDEPTNHLDIDAIRWLEDFLRDFAGAVLFVTHDRAFLAALATRIVELDRGRLTSWPGSYAHVPREEGGRARTPKRASSSGSTRSSRRKKPGCGRASRRGGRATRGACALMALRAERAAHRAQAGSVRMAVDAGRAHRASWCSRRSTSASRSAACRSSATTRSGSCAAIASA